MDKDNWYTYKATKPKHIQCVDEGRMIIWDIREYDDGFVIPAKGDLIWLGDNLFEVDHLTHHPDGGLLVIVMKHIGTR